jgi:hypothetical protein
VLNGRHHALARQCLPGREMLARLGGHFAALMHVKVALQLVGKVNLEQLARLLGGALDSAACVLIHQ